MMATTPTVSLTAPSWLWSKYVRHSPWLLTNPDVEAAAIRRGIAASGPLKAGADYTISVPLDAADWLEEVVREWVAEDTERDGAFAMATFADHIADQLEAIEP
jgi:hypothetical protein